MAPYILLSAVIGAMYGTLFHLWRGKNLVDLPIYALTGMVGFGLGQALGDLVGLDLARIGPIHFFEATIISWASLLLVYWLKIK